MKLYSNLSISDIDESLTYSDIGLVPVEVSTLKHRSEADTTSDFLGYKLTIPVISSPMESVTGLEMSKTLREFNVLAILNRFDDSLSKLEDKFDNGGGIEEQSISLGLNDPDDIYQFWYDACNPIICVDTANAQNKEVLNKVESLKSKFQYMRLIVGNIAYSTSNTSRGNILKDLDAIGVDAVRIGVGNGSACSTSVKTGIGLGQVSSISSCYLSKFTYGLKIKLIADGGISSVGDIAKAIALGCDAVMLGRMLSGTKEAPGNIIKTNEGLFKVYRGSASFGVKQNNKYIEGEETLVPYKGTVIDVLNSISDGLQSSMAYLDARTLDEFRKNAVFCKLSQSSYLERLPKV
jgi:IMP dehydrogenase/GMP reductase